MFPYWPLYLQHISFNTEQIGMLLAIPMLTKVLAPNLWSWLADTTGQRLGIIQLGSFLGLVCFAGILVGNAYWWLVIVMVTYSFFWNAVLPQYEVITLDYLGDRPERYSRLRVWGSVGFIAAVAGTGVLYEHVGINIFPWIGLVLLASIVCSSLVVPKPPNRPRRQPAHSLLKTIWQKPILSFLMAGVLLQMAHGAYYSFFSIYMEELAYSRTEIGLLWAIGVVAEVVIFLVMHNVLLSFGVRKVLIVSLLLAAIRWAVIGHLADSLVLLIFAQCLHAFTFGTFHAAAIDTIRRLFNSGTQGGGQALYGAVSFGIGGALGSYLAGRYWHYGAEAVFSAAALVCVVATVIAWYGFRDARLR